jgi:hypothetical protein
MSELDEVRQALLVGFGSGCHALILPPSAFPNEADAEAR